MKSAFHKVSKTLVLVFLFTSPITTNGAEDLTSNAPTMYSAEAVREDLAFLYKTLQISSYDLFLHMPKTDYDKAFEPVMKFWQSMKLTSTNYSGRYMPINKVELTMPSRLFWKPGRLRPIGGMFLVSFDQAQFASKNRMGSK